MTRSDLPRLMLDEMLSGVIAAQLRLRGIDVIAVVEDAALVSTLDEDLLTYATQERRVVVTVNISDFAAIANDWQAAGRIHHGLVYIASRTFPQDRSFVGHLVDALAPPNASNGVADPGREVFLSRIR